MAQHCHSEERSDEEYLEYKRSRDPSSRWGVTQDDIVGEESHGSALSF
jgi:hypothetical protein